MQMQNVETMAKIGVGVGLVGIATGVGGILAAKKVGDGVAAMAGGLP